MNDTQLEQAIAAKPAPKVTADAMTLRITDVQYIQVAGTTVTICHLMLDNGFSVRGESACVNPENFDLEIGMSLAYKDAFNKLWPLFGFLLAEDQYRAKQRDNVPASA